MLDFQQGMKPMVIYGLKHAPVEHQTQRHFIIFSCLIPGALIPMQGRYDIYHVHKFDPNGYELDDGWERRAKACGDEVYCLAHALQRTEGLHWLYIFPTGFVAMGEEHMAKCAPAIMTKMRQALEEVCGPIDFNEIPGRELWLPSFKGIELAKESGMLLPI